MPKWMKVVRGAIGLGLLWGAVWALVGGGIMEGIVDPAGRILDMWPQVLGLVGFVGGVIFATIIGIVGARHGFDEFTFAQFARLGALAGIIQGLVAMALVGAPLLFIGITMLATSGVATGSLALARMAEKQKLLNAR